jgi:5-methylthioadenosine/S-adenosylhomocysteine deaminase
MGGAKALGRAHELGAIEKGRIADLTGYNLHSLPFTPLNNPVHQLVCAACRHEVDFVMVDGEPILQHGKLTRVDEDRLIDEIAAAHQRLEPLIAQSEKDVERLLPAYQRIYRRCEKIAISPDTYPARFDH